MADNKPTPVQPPIDPRSMAAFAFLSTPEGQDFLAAQTELVELQRDEIKERRTAEQNRRTHLLQARANEARAQERNRQLLAAKQNDCPHRHENGRSALGGQRFARGGLREWVLRCQLCGKEYDNKNPAPEHLKVAIEAVGGPNF